ncbi:V-type ATP synthase subunit D [bacterium]
MLLNVTPTRMELINLKNKLIIARRGHRLLKDKLDELVKGFMELIDALKSHKQQTFSMLEISFKSLAVTKSSSMPAEMKTAFSLPWKKSNIAIDKEYIVGTKVPSFNIVTEYKDEKSTDYAFNFPNLSKEYSNTLFLYEKLMKDMVKLGELEQKISILGNEIEKTRRRVNALEHTLIPNLLETVRYISSKIEEMERGNIVRIMKIKDIVRKH